MKPPRRRDGYNFRNSVARELTLINSYEFRKARGRGVP